MVRIQNGPHTNFAYVSVNSENQPIRADWWIITHVPEHVVPALINITVMILLCLSRSDPQTGDLQRQNTVLPDQIRLMMYSMAST